MEMDRRLWGLAFIGLVVLLVSAVLCLVWTGPWGLDFLAPLLRMDIDRRDAALAGLPPPPISPQLVLVTVDEASLDALGRWPWPRSYHARLIERLARAGARVIVFDVAFPYPSDPAQDRALVKAVKRAGNVVLATQFYSGAEGELHTREPFPALRDAAAGLGVSLLPQDPLDRVIRSVQIQQEPGQDWGGRQALALAAVGRFSDLQGVPLMIGGPDGLGGRQVVWGPYRFRVGDHDLKLPIRFTGSGRHFNAHSYLEVLRARVPDSAFSGRIVLVHSAASLYDRFPVPAPFSGGTAQMSGGEIHAQAINTILTNLASVAQAPMSWTFLVTLGLCLPVLLILYYRHLPAAVLAALLLGMGFIWGQGQYFAATGRWIPLPPVLIPMILLLLMALIYETRHLAGVFSQFVPHRLAKWALASSRNLNLGGVRKDATILFGDIRGYTALAETLPPDQLMAVLNEYHEAMHLAFERHGGIVLDLEGDAQMVGFGVLERQPDHALAAVKAALMMRRLLEEMHQRRRREEKPVFEMGVGICSGEVAVGLVGVKARKQYAAVGDTTNVAARLQALSEELDAPILISESTYLACHGAVEAEPLEAQLLRGKTVPVNVYRVKGLAGKGT